MSKHTPGPWKMGDIENMRFPIIPECRAPIALAYTAFNGLPIETDRANGLLIAKAPELVETCGQLLVGYIDMHRTLCSMKQIPPWSIDAPWVEKARALIAEIDGMAK